jgi:hypothetical protein
MMTSINGVAARATLKKKNPQKISESVFYISIII